MLDGLLTGTDREEAISRCYANVIAAGAGYVTQPPSDFDRDSVDLGFSAGGASRPKIDAQLKATINLRQRGANFAFSLRKKNYDDLRAPTMVPRIIVVLALPRKEADWLNVSLRRLLIRRCAYWTSLKGMPELPASQQSITIEIPAANTFDVDGLRQLMERARRGTPL